MHVSRLRHILGSAPAARTTRLIRRSRENHGSIHRSCRRAIDDKRHGVVLHLHQLRCIVRDLLRRGGDCGDRLAGIADHRIAGRGFLFGVAQLGHAVHILDDMHRAHSGQPLGSAGVDGNDAAMGNARIHHARVEHARQLHVSRVLTRAHGLGRPVVTHGWLADVSQFRVLRQRRWFVQRNLAFLLRESVLRNAKHKLFGARRR